jgi:hypothetical protein
MPRAVPYATRQEIVRRHLDGQTLLRIAADLHLPLATVRDLWRAFRDHGDDGLVIRDPACGRSTPGHHRHVLRRACQLKRRRPTWGAGRVRVELLGLLAATLVPSARTLQRAFQKEGINRPRRTQRPRTARARPEAPHDLWEVDAVEKKRLQTGVLVSWMTVLDAYSGALLAGELSPPGSMADDPAPGRPGLVSPRLQAVGLAADGPGRQWPPLGLEPGPAAGAGVVADRAGGGGGVDRPGPAPAEPARRAGQRGDAAVGRAGHMHDTFSIAITIT